MSTPRPEIRKPFQRVRYQVDVSGAESVVDRSFGNDTDVNKIVARFTRDPDGMPEQGEQQYGDVTGIQGDLDKLIDRSRAAAAEYAQAEKELEARQAEIIAQNAAKAAELEKLLQSQQHTETIDKP